MTEQPDVLYDVQDRIATITLNRPEKLNAFTSRMMLDLISAFDATDADDAVRVAIAQGAEQDGVDDGKDGRVSADAERECQDHREGEDGSATELAEGVTHVLDHAGL